MLHMPKLCFCHLKSLQKHRATFTFQLCYVSFLVSFNQKLEWLKLTTTLGLLIGIYLPLTGRRVFDWISSLNPAADDLQPSLVGREILKTASFDHVALCCSEEEQHNQESKQEELNTEFLNGSDCVFKIDGELQILCPIQAIHTWACYQTFCFGQYQLYVHRDQIHGAA